MTERMKESSKLTELSDLAVELVGAVERVVIVKVLLLLLEEADVLHQARLDVVVEQELGEDDELATQELVREVDLFGRAERDSSAIRWQHQARHRPLCS